MDSIFFGALSKNLLFVHTADNITIDLAVFGCVCVCVCTCTIGSLHLDADPCDMFIRNINCDFSFYVLPTPLLIRYHSSSYLIYFLILSMCKNNIYFLFFFWFGTQFYFVCLIFFPSFYPATSLKQLEENVS